MILTCRLRTWRGHEKTKPKILCMASISYRVHKYTHIYSYTKNACSCCNNKWNINSFLVVINTFFTYFIFSLSVDFQNTMSCEGLSHYWWIINKQTGFLFSKRSRNSSSIRLHPKTRVIFLSVLNRGFLPY